MLDKFDAIADKLFGTSKKPIENAEDQTRDEQDLAAYVRSRVEDARMSGSRVAHEGIWMTNIAC